MSLGTMIKTDKPIVVFDTECVLCRYAVPFILSRERMSSLRFVAAWSEEGIALAAQHGFSWDDLARTFFVITGMRVLTRSDAALEIAKHLRKLWSFLFLLRALPQRIHDVGYDLVARHRLQLFGRRKSCMGILTCPGIFHPAATRVRPKEGMDDEANNSNRRTDHWDPA